MSGEVQSWMLGRVRETLAAASELTHDDVLTLRPLLQLKYSTGNSHSTGLYCLLPELLRLMRSNLTYAVTFTNYVLDAPRTEVSQSMKDELLSAVAQDLSAFSIDMRDQETVSNHGDVSGPQPQAKHSAAALGIFIKHFYNAGLYKPIESMLAHLRSEMAHAQSIDLHIIYVPLLQELIGLMLVYGIPITNVTYSAFFEVVLRQYLERFVGLRANQAAAAEQARWKQRGLAARAMLKSFDHSHFRDILGDRYDNVVLPAMMELPHNEFDSFTTTKSKASTMTDDNMTDPALAA